MKSPEDKQPKDRRKEVIQREEKRRKRILAAYASLLVIPILIGGYASYRAFSGGEDLRTLEDSSKSIAEHALELKKTQRAIESTSKSIEEDSKNLRGTLGEAKSLLEGVPDYQRETERMNKELSKLYILLVGIQKEQEELKHIRLDIKKQSIAIEDLLRKMEDIRISIEKTSVHDPLRYGTYDIKAKETTKLHALGLEVQIGQHRHLDDMVEDFTIKKIREEIPREEILYGPEDVKLGNVIKVVSDTCDYFITLMSVYELPVLNDYIQMSIYRQCGVQGNEQNI